MPIKSQVLSRGPRSRYAIRFFSRTALWAVALLFFLTLVRTSACLLYSLPAAARMTDVLHAFWLGLRFDLSAICYILALPTLLAGPWIALGTQGSLRALQNFVKSYLAVFSFLVIFISVIDLFFYSYFQDHLNILIFGFFEDDTKAVVQSIWKNYPVVPGLLAIGLVTWGLWKGLRRLFQITADENWSAPQLFFFPGYLILILSVSLGARGSLGLFPLGVADTAISSEPFVNYLAFNGVHSLHRAVKLRLRERSVWNINEKTYGYTDAKTAAQDFLGRQLPDSNDPLTWIRSRTPVNPWAEKTKPHVIVLMMESFGSYWLRESREDFDLTGELRKHLREDYLFLNFVPSMTATIGSLSALMINTPHRPEGGFLTESRYLQVPFRTAPARIYRANGYKTRFIYGGAIGWRDIDKFARTQGFESIEGDFDVEAKLGRKLEKHDWGLYDEDVWAYLEATLKEAISPELVVVMTTTNHPPYQLPSNYRPGPLNIPESLKKRLNVDEKLAHARFAAFQYSNQKLGEFLTRLKSSPLAERTLIAATGDHGFLLVNFEEGELLRKWQVPLYLYLPTKIRPKKVNLKAFGSHADLFPTLMPLSLSNVEIAGFGHNLLDPDAQHDAFHFSRLAMNRDGAVLVENASKTRYFQWKEGEDLLRPSDPTPPLESLSKRYKALMSFLDEFYEFERRNKGSHENSRR
jgi:phosphoglycerol transferase MdoB-like AlkP superfamily enzyme